MSSRWYQTRYAHKISPRSTDRGPDLELSPEHLATRRTLAKALRQGKVLNTGETISHFRVEDGKILAFPAHSIWQSVTLTPIEMSAEEKTLWWVVVDRFCMARAVFDAAEKGDAEAFARDAYRQSGHQSRIVREEKREPKVGDLFSPCEICGGEPTRREGSNCYGCGLASEMGS